MRVDVLELIVALIPSNVTTVAFSRRLPVMTTVPPTGLESGLNFKTTGSACALADPAVLVHDVRHRRRAATGRRARRRWWS